METDQQNSSNAHNVRSLHGGAVHTGEPNESFVKFLECALEQARAGETVGGVFAFLHKDSTASSSVVGAVGPSSLAGQWAVGNYDLMKVMDAMRKMQE